MRPSKPTPATPLSVATQFSQLPELAMADIKSLWQRLFHAANPTHNRQFLERRIAYKLQEIEFRKVDPGLLDRNKRRIENLIETGKVKTRDPDYRPVAGTMLKGAAHPVQGWCAMGATITVNHQHSLLNQSSAMLTTCPRPVLHQNKVRFIF